MSARPISRLPLVLLVVVATFACGLVGWCVATRFAYPCELSKMEGGFVDHVRRAALGLPIYGPPSSEFVAFIYTPLSYWVAGALMHVGLDGFHAARLVSILGVIGATGVGMAIVRRAVAAKKLALLVPVLVIARYFVVECFYDQARPDDLMILFWMASLGALTLESTRRAALLFALFGTLTMLTKQSTLVLYPFLLGGLLFVRPKLALCAAAGLALLAGVAYFALDSASDGWLHVYTFVTPAYHRFEGRQALDAVVHDLLLTFGISTLAALAAGIALLRRMRARRPDTDAASRTRTVLTLAMLAALVFSVASIGQPFAVKNVYILYSATGAAFLPVAVDWAIGAIRDERRRERAWTFVPLLPAAIVVLGLRDPRPFLPSAGDERVWIEMREKLRSRGPAVRAWVTIHAAPFGADLAAPMLAHVNGIRDLVGGRYGGMTGRARPDEILGNIKSHWYTVIVVAEWDEETKALIRDSYAPDPTLGDVRLPALSGYPSARELYWVPK